LPCAVGTLAIHAIFGAFGGVAGASIALRLGHEFHGWSGTPVVARFSRLDSSALFVLIAGDLVLCAQNRFHRFPHSASNSPSSTIDPLVTPADSNQWHHSLSFGPQSHRAIRVGDVLLPASGTFAADPALDLP